MRNHTQNPSAPEKTGSYQDQQIIHQAEISAQLSNKQKLQSVFNLVKSIKGKQAIICTALTGEQATCIVTTLSNELNSPLLIKFVGMEVAR